GEDVLLLVEHFNRQIATAAGEDPLEFSQEALDALLAYHWPGNVRELKNLIGRLHVLARGRDIGLHDLPGEIAAPSATSNDGKTLSAELPGGTLVEAERQAMKNALAAEGGNLSRVARRLGISRPTLYRKLDQYGIRRGFT
ncbi:MAG: sigma-54-dependent Fis family transcriptional regulator, partial [Mesorhizobium sp.]